MESSKIRHIAIPEGTVVSIHRNGALFWSKSENTDIPATGLLAIFDLGENGKEAHTDGTKMDTTHTYLSTSGKYSLNLTNIAYTYYGAYDTQGNSCIKIGHSKYIGNFTFIVPQEVNKVSLHIAKYKTNVSKITINGGSPITLTKVSTHSEYDVIDIDTSVEKQVTISTVENYYRAMINTIEFYD